MIAAGSRAAASSSRPRADRFTAAPRTAAELPRSRVSRGRRWDPTETGAGGGDQSPTGPNPFPGQPIPLSAAAKVYPSSDLTIHALPQAGPADADWFSFTLAPPQQGQWKWWYGDVTFNVPDTQYADLQVQAFAPDPNNPSNPTLIQPAFSQDSSNGTAWVRAPFELGKSYLIKVSGVNAGDSNCYDHLTLRMLPDLKAPNPNPFGP